MVIEAPNPTPCPMCGAREARLVTASPVHLARDEGLRFHWARCQECDLVRLVDPPTEAALSAYYGPDYLPHRGPEAWGRWAFLVRWSARRVDRRRVEIARRALAPPSRRPDPETIRVLDVGCGRPTFLRAFQAATGGRGAGVDSSDAGWREDPAGAWSDLDLRVGRVEAAGLPTGTFDVVTLWHALEHLSDPRSVLRHLFDLAQPGGALVAEVPDHASLTRRLQGARWIGYDTPRHTVAYEPHTLRRILTETGWTVEKIHRWGSMDPWVLWWLGRQVGKGRALDGSLEGVFLPFLAGKVLTLPVGVLQRWLPLGAMIAVARRKESA